MSVNTEHVKFISYTGKYPNLCTGKLTLEICGKIYEFDRPFWYSGGCATFINGDYGNPCVEKGAWVINTHFLPAELRKYASEIDIVFNANVKQGCCGGCL